MRLTKYTHACVALESLTSRLVIDPGIWSEAAVWQGTDAVLITHEHVDHFDVEALRRWLASNSSARAYAPSSVTSHLADLGDAVVTVAAGDSISVAGFDVQTVGGEHAEIIDGLPGCANVGYLVDASVYHPGDSFFVPSEEVSTALVPTSGPWVKLRESIEFVRAIAPTRAFSIHDAPLNEIAMGMVDGWIERSTQTDYARAILGEPIEL